MDETSLMYSKELDEVVLYMETSIFNEIPSKEFTPEHFVLAMLDTKNCHAHMILESYLMNNNIISLRELFANALTASNNEISGLTNDIIEIPFSKDMNKLMEDADNEKEITKSSILGTEHFLLALLNPELNLNSGKILKSAGIDYNNILSKCQSETKNRRTKKQKNKNNNMNIPPKSEVNIKSVSPKDNFIKQYTINLNQIVKEGKVDKTIGREKELKIIMQVLSRRRKNNVVLVGKGGVGKTSIVYGLAKLINEHKVPSVLDGKELLLLNIMSMVSGTSLRGMFEERVKGLFDELENNDKYILVIDDMQMVLKNGNKDRDTDISDKIGKILEDGNVRVIGTLPFKEYRNCIENNTQLSRKLQKIVIEPNNVSETIQIIKENKKFYEDYHNTIYSDEIIKKAVELSEKYINDRCLPDSAIDVIDLAGAGLCLTKTEPEMITSTRRRLNEISNEKKKYMNNGEWELVEDLNKEEKSLNRKLTDYRREQKKDNKNIVPITENDIAKVISDITGVPVAKLSSDEKTKIAHIDNILKESIIGQDEAVEAICKVIKRNKVGLGDKTKTMANILMMGPSGCGKTLIAKKLAEEVFGDEKSLIRIDMSEYSEKNSVSKLTGASPGYVGYENGGQLTEAIKNKQHCVLLLDEIEKADQEVYNLFLQLFDDGRLTDSSGQLVNFKNVIVLMTSNIGAKQASEFGKSIGFYTNVGDNKKAIIEKEMKSKFTPEFLNRIDQIVYFNSLTDDNLKGITELEIKKFAKRVNQAGYNVAYTPSVVDFIYQKAVQQKEYGARPIIRFVQNELEDKLTDEILLGDYENGHIFNFDFKNELTIS